MAGAALLVILLDLAVPRKGILPYAAFVFLAAPFVLSLIQLFDLGDSRNLVRGAGLDGSGEPSILLSSLAVDKFALFFNFLITAAAGAGGAGVHRLRAEPVPVPGRILRAGALLGHRDDAAGGGHRANHHLRRAGADHSPLGRAGRFPDERPVQRGGDEVPHHRGHQLCGHALRHGLGVRGHRQHAVGRHIRRGGPDHRQRGLRRLRAAGRHRADGGGVRLQDFRRALPDVGAGRIRRGAHPGGGVLVGGQQSRRLRHSAPGVLHRILRRCARLGRAHSGAGGGFDDYRQRGGHRAEQHPALVRLQHHRPRRVSAGGRGPPG